MGQLRIRYIGLFGSVKQNRFALTEMFLCGSRLFYLMINLSIMTT